MAPEHRLRLPQMTLSTMGVVIRTFIVTEGSKTQISSLTEYAVGDIS